ncbi:DeoR/GlpR family transcriptional regulator of sugar metabolism [Pedobacter cryoconitis]|uniref:DeoR/GlpR family DNA-binding transcription regulator n=1 Tax=Pedobacter cryoconitis TaxID=188932 RepID=UPI00161BA30B|nr:DeoR/GlpR family DNA-binding transcription regulator [Pedobacter cryoconitis]MBB6270799.1 DeoR/GlpR family transcriptional regulator of sugar metabolism [Pedobacter cryoconitis]
MIREKRFEHIISSLKNTDMVTYSVMSADLSVSEDTIRRDIDYLHDNGLLSKVRGGAISRNKNPLSFQDRTNFQSTEKEVIAMKAQSLLKPGMTVFMDGGTTVCAIAECLPTNTSLRVITNNIALIPLLGQFRDIEVIVLGGNYDRDTQTNTGARTCDEAAQFVVDLYLMGTCAISKDFGITASMREDGAVKKAMLKGSKKVVVLSNSRKIGTNEPFVVCGLQDTHVLITELPSNDPKLDELRFKNLKII